MAGNAASLSGATNYNPAGTLKVDTSTPSAPPPASVTQPTGPADGDDTVTGTAGPDTLDAGDGNDTVSGGAGADNIDLGPGGCPARHPE